MPNFQISGNIIGRDGRRVYFLKQIQFNWKSGFHALLIRTGADYPQWNRDLLCCVYLCSERVHHLRWWPLESALCRQTFGSGADLAMLGTMFSTHIEYAREVRERNSCLKLCYGMSFETAMKKYARGVAEYRASERNTREVTSKGNIEKNILDITVLYKSSWLVKCFLLSSPLTPPEELGALELSLGKQTFIGSEVQGVYFLEFMSLLLKLICVSFPFLF